MDKKQTYFLIALILIGFLLVESSIYIVPYIEGLKELEIAVFVIGILVLLGVIILLERTKKHHD
ncbi:hypothetical protein HMPREF9422_0380 [Streptococcus cristatus ATCC 51100]|jgi:hypothetical protein|uniref:Uncharacterized protein n=1 Tax=Streptococcus cristatus ATCC 51100 TaxID=889201 RepID=A0AAV3EFN2_STRCR|nr:hypothetical protein [Streptococcus cristatus]EFX53544.1 hypothetical protein HMPREF9422_0380 [Streptococcus cristatus ATCC 51100]EGU68002.1 hypothetical protein HMPREF9960_1637 [Streptococcus cristatus ATCC 51100]KJQ56918.1 hypothetical protein TZ85_01251 [Streptococcus cristatus]SQG32411.1 Uncharacterised protein [Streptococcus cristatus ATCC 51100]